MGKACSKHGSEAESYGDLVGKQERKTSLERPKRGWQDNIKMDPREEGWGGMKSIDLAEDRDHWRAPVNTVMNVWIAYNFGHFMSI
jgi:hypothetical protein